MRNVLPSPRIDSEVIKSRLMLTVSLSRPLFLPATFWVITAGVLTTGELTVPMIPGILLLSFLSQTAVFSLNDYFDRDTDQFNDRKGGINGAVVNEDNRVFVRNLSIISHLLLGFLAFFMSIFSLLSGLIVLSASFLYSAPPARLKSVPILDSVSNIVILYFTFCLGVGLAGGGLNDVVSGALWFALAFGGPGHMFASYIDRKSDREAGIKTSGILLGRKGIVIIGQAILVLMLLLEKWSAETRFVLFYSLITAFYPLITDYKLKRMLYLWSIIPLLYVFLWIWLRL